ncbi:MAG: epoxyqueuosine reductase [Candidatus Abyssobacteria bacterium SURF_5]|uniref:Epoxyqueuosine reductase n=1 Tax=Abyssobacteria bacterium (strain SURF_5) TaxID=2093360 RepID=A0A3A4NL46_ABYX5|nr:MAG: epoxyqueuosine reductase [Candidatus Abyssubacteria bacterium SURF_5]
MREADRLRALAISAGASLFGVADLDVIRAETDLLDSCYNDYTRGISLGVRLNPAALADIVSGPTAGYCAEYLRVNALLDALATDVAAELKSMGARAECIPASRVVDWEKLRGHLSHKLIGRYAGHGWIGKNILLVNPDFGARVRYVTVLTDLPLEPNVPTGESCGACSRCVRVCPAGAIAQEPAQFDLMACFQQLIRFNDLLGDDHYICGLCVSACRGKTAGRDANDGTGSDASPG